MTIERDKTIVSQMRKETGSEQEDPSLREQFKYMLQRKFGGSIEAAVLLSERAGNEISKDIDTDIYSIDILSRNLEMGVSDTVTRLKFDPSHSVLTLEILMRGLTEKILYTGCIYYVKRISALEVEGGHNFRIESGSREVLLRGKDGTVDHR